MSVTNPMEGVVIPLGTGDPSKLLYEYVCAANEAWTRAETSYISHIRKMAHLVREAERGAAMAGVSFRSLFNEGGSHATHPVFCFSREKAKKLLAIAKNPALMSDRNVDRLPGDYTTLAKLAQIPAPKLTKLIEEGNVSKNTNRKQASGLAGSKPETKRPARTTEPDAKVAKTLSYSALRDELIVRLMKLTESKRADELRSLAEDCGIEGAAK